MIIINTEKADQILVALSAVDIQYILGLQGVVAHTDNLGTLAEWLQMELDNVTRVTSKPVKDDNTAEKFCRINQRLDLLFKRYNELVNKVNKLIPVKGEEYDT